MVAANPVPFEERAASLAALLGSKLTSRGTDLATLSLVSPVLVVFLRHPGCTFCREALADLAAARAAIEKSGTRIIVVHAGAFKALEPLLRLNRLTDLERINDDDQSLYRAFGLKRGTLWQLAGPRVWWRSIRAAFFEGHGVGRPQGDIKQLPGLFLLDRCEVVRSFRHRGPSDRPLYEAFVMSGLNSEHRRDIQ